MGAFDSFVINKFGTAGEHQISSQKSAVTISFEGVNLREYGMIATTLDIQETEDTSLQSSCGDMHYVYSTGSGIVNITVEGSLVVIKDGNGKDWSSFYKTYKVTQYKKALRIAVNKAVYYGILVDCNARQTTVPADGGTFVIKFLGVAA